MKIGNGDPNFKIHIREYTPDDLEACLSIFKANHDALIERLRLPADRALRLYPQYGNVGAAGVPFTLATAVEQGRIQSGDTALLMGIGSGLNCTMLGVQW